MYDKQTTNFAVGAVHSGYVNNSLGASEAQPLGVGSSLNMLQDEVSRLLQNVNALENSTCGSVPESDSNASKATRTDMAFTITQLRHSISSANDRISTIIQYINS
jgi:galactitol-specific phosphotransferase system IIB component